MMRPPEGTAVTFQIPGEGHTLGNVLRFMLNKECAPAAWPLACSQQRVCPCCIALLPSCASGKCAGFNAEH